MKISNFVIISHSHKIVSLLSLCSINNIVVYNGKKIESGFQFELDEKNYNKFRKLDLAAYDIEIVSIGGKRKFVGQVVYRIGLVVGMFICCISMMFLNGRIFQIHISGLNTITKDEVISELSANGVGLFSKMNFSVGNIEKILADRFNFSLVSIITKGNSLIVSIKESLPDLEDLYTAITADYNMVINSITTYSGTQIVRVGDIVYKGDVLVQPFIEKNGDRVYVSPCADIVATIYFSESYKFMTTEEKLVPTGKKQLISSSINLGKWNIASCSSVVKFENYKIEKFDNMASQYFLPICITKSYACELSKETIHYDFDSEKDLIVAGLKDSVYASLGDHKISSEDVSITEISGGYIVNYHAESVINLKYQYYG